MPFETLLVVDDDPDLLRLVCYELEREGFTAVPAQSGRAALDWLESNDPGAVVLDLMIPDVPGIELLEILDKSRPELPVVILTARNATDEAVRCMRAGATDFVTKPFEAARLLASVRNAVRQRQLAARIDSLERVASQPRGFGGLIGESPSLRRSIELLRRAAESDVTVLLEGESGTGKEVAARAIHAEGSRAKGPFVAINCGAIPESLIESELFGHERGAFTGADDARPGCFEEAHDGTLLLDEIGELRSDLQVRLLRVLQQREVQRLGSSRSIPIDTRVIAATNRDLHEEIRQGRFREDLYFRLAVFPIRLPPLRERREDLALLSQMFLERFAAQHGKNITGMSPDTYEKLESHNWPGNVRELMNTLERAVIMTDSGRVEAIHIFFAPLAESAKKDDPSPERAAVSSGCWCGAGESADRILLLEEYEKKILQRALAITGWNVKKTAQLLGIARATLYRKIERLGVQQTR